MENGTASLDEGFRLMKNVAETRPSIDTPDPFGQDLYVICAEIAFQVKYPVVFNIKSQCVLCFYQQHCL